MDGKTLKIHSVFRLSNGSTVIACDRPSSEISWKNRKVAIVSSDGEQRQELLVFGMRNMLRQSERLDEIAIESTETVHLKDEEVNSGRWMIVV